MALIKPTRGAQYVVCSEYAFNFNDTVVDINGVTKDYGSATIASAPVADIINMPRGAEVVGGHIAVVTQGVGPTAYTVSLGVSGAATAYHSAADLLSATGAKIALTNSAPLASVGGLNVRLTMVDSVAVATAGSWIISVLWKMQGRQNEAVPS